jgi:hypothetical protein
MDRYQNNLTRKNIEKTKLRTDMGKREKEKKVKRKKKLME